MVCKIAILLLMSICSIHAQLDVSFMRFYKNDKDFISDLRLLSTERFNHSYLQVFYNSKKIPLLKEWVEPSGEVTKREILEYDNKQKLIRKYYAGNDQQIDSVKYFGESEPWSLEFRKVLSENRRDYFQNQQTMFTLNSSNRFESIRFKSAQGVKYGQIDFIYDHLGFLVGEIWKDIPKSKIIRKFSYSIDILTGKKEIREFNQNLEQISYIVLSQLPAETLYKTPPPKYGNNLDEISILIEDIKSKNLRIPFDVFIPKTDHDLMFLSNGDSLMIDSIQFRQQHVLFRIPGEKQQLTMPKSRVKSVVSRYGEQIYP